MGHRFLYQPYAARRSRPFPSRSEVTVVGSTGIPACAPVARVTSSAHLQSTRPRSFLHFVNRRRGQARLKRGGGTPFDEAQNKPALRNGRRSKNLVRGLHRSCFLL